MPCATGIVGGLQRFPDKARHLVTTKTRYPWRYCSKRKTYRHSTAEKQALTAQRKERKLSYHNALHLATEAIQNEAKKLHEQFGGHSVDYYMRQIMQTSHIHKKSRSVNKWNIYLRQEVKRINDGRPYFTISDCC
jgi:hypothetical protein